jgi:hypothetical protein
VDWHSLTPNEKQKEKNITAIKKAKLQFHSI